MVMISKEIIAISSPPLILGYGALCACTNSFLSFLPAKHDPVSTAGLQSSNIK